MFEELVSLPLFVRAIENRKRQVEVLFDVGLREPIARLAVPTIDPRSAQLSNILYAEVRLKSVWETLAMVGLEADRDAYVVNSLGRVVAHRNPSVVLRGTVIGECQSELSKGLSGKISVIHSHQGKLDSLGLQVIVEQPVTQAYQLIRNVLFDVVLISCLALVLAYSTWIYFNKKVIVPLHKLSKAAREMGDGQFPEPLKATDLDELNILVSSFNQMVVDLNHAQKRDKMQATELAIMNKELEEEYRLLEITERKLRKSQNLLKHAQQIAQLGNWEWDIESDRYTCSNEICTILGLSEKELALGVTSILNHVDPLERDQVKKYWLTIPEKNKHIQWTNKLILNGGVEKYVTHRSEAIYDKSGQPTKVIGVMQDITVQRKNELKIWYQAHYDFLTGLVNRNLFHDRIEQAMAHGKRNNSKVGLLFIDLDNFKQINDTLGHSTGDRVLKEVATRLLSSVRKEDTVARLGGDEFVVLLGELSSREQVDVVAEKSPL